MRKTRSGKSRDFVTKSSVGGSLTTEIKPRFQIPPASLDVASGEARAISTASEVNLNFSKYPCTCNKNELNTCYKGF